MIVTAANKRYEQFVQAQQLHCSRLGYRLTVFDLGDLGWGQPNIVTHSHFHEHGWYHQMHGTWRTKALHKPALIQRALDTSPLTYLDADAIPVQHFDEVWDHSFDLGVTQRRSDELHQPILGDINAGVLFFRPSARKYLAKWAELTAKHGNDQRGLQDLIRKTDIKVHYFPCAEYNWYYWPEEPGPDVKILHFKDDPVVRPYFRRWQAEYDQAMCQPDAVNGWQFRSKALSDRSRSNR